MTKLNLTECCLLEASGELGEKARAGLYAYLDRHPVARAQLVTAKADLAMLQSLPHTELSAQHRMEITDSIKRAVRRKLERVEREEEARRRWRLIFRAVGTLSAAAAVIVVIAGIVMIDRSAHQRRAIAEFAKSSRAVDHLSVYEDRPTKYDQAIGDVESSIRQLQSQGTAAAELSTGEMANLFDALASVPAQSDDDAPETGSI